MSIWSRVRDLEAAVIDLQQRVEELETPRETHAIGFHWEPHEYDEWEYEDEPCP